MNHDLITAQAGTIFILGVSTGLQPALMIAGAAGGWLAMTYIGPLSWYDRVNRVFLSSLASSWGTMVLLEHFDLYEDAQVFQFAVSFVIGLLTMDVIGKGIIKIAKKWLGDQKWTKS